jgi:single-strand DNA-binding protein
MSLNKAMLIGRLGADPELRHTQAGNPVASFNIATSEVWNDKSGKKQEKTEWHKITVFGNQALTAANYLAKGREVYVEGRIQTDEWQDKEGKKRYTTKIIASTIQFLGSKGDGGGGGKGYEPNDEPSGNFDQSFNDDDIPF